MMLDRDKLSEALSLGKLTDRLRKFDRYTVLMIVMGWGIAFLMMLFAFYMLQLANNAKQDVVMIKARDPGIMQINRQAADPTKLQALAQDLQKTYPALHFALQDKQLVVTSNDGDKFRQWLAALNDIDVSDPMLHWSIAAFCVGKCPTNDLMRAALSAESISFSISQ